MTDAMSVLATSPPPPAQRRAVRLSTGRAGMAQGAIFALTAFVVAAPLVPIAYQSVLNGPLYRDDAALTWENYQLLVTSAEVREVLLNTAWFAVLTACLALALGAGAAFLVLRTDLPGRRLLGGIFLWPLYTSALVLAFGWVIAYGPSGFAAVYLRDWTGLELAFDWIYTLPGMAMVAGVAEAPLAYIFCSRALRLSNPALEEAARVSGGGRAAILRHVSLPLMRPALSYSAILVFVAALETLSIPLILGTPHGIELFSNFLFREGLTRPDPNYGLLAAAALTMVSLILMLMALQRRLLGDARKYVTLTGKSAPQRAVSLGRARWPLTAALGAYCLLACVLPVVGIALRSLTTILIPGVALRELLTLDHFRALWEADSYRSAIETSAVISVVGSAVAVALALGACLVAHRSSFRLGPSLAGIAVAPRAIPAIVVSIGMFWAMFLIPVLGPLRGTMWILVLAFTVRFLPLAVGVIAPSLMSVDRSLDQAARVAGAGWWTTVTRVVSPLIGPSIVGAYVLMFAHFIREYAAAVFIISPGTNVIGTSMLQLWEQGVVGVVAAFAMVQVVLCVVLIKVAGRISGGDVHG